MSSELTIDGTSYPASGGLDLDRSFELYIKAPSYPETGDSYQYKGGLKANTYGDLLMSYQQWASTSEASTVGPEVKFQGARRDWAILDWHKEQKPPPLPANVGILAKAEGYAQIFDDGGGLEGNAKGLGWVFDVNGVKAGTYWGYSPGEHKYDFNVNATIPINPDGSFSWDLNFGYTIPNSNWCGIMDFSHTISLVSILMPDGTTPESQGWELTFASGALSPNLRPVPEPSALVALASLAPAALVFAWLRRKR